MELGVKNITGLPSWVYDIQWGWIFGVVIGAAVLVAGISLILRANQR
jgi:hypothetical protein